MGHQQGCSLILSHLPWTHVLAVRSWPNASCRQVWGSAAETCLFQHSLGAMLLTVHPLHSVYNIHWPESGNPNIPSCFCRRAAAVQAAAVAMCSPGPETQLLCIRIKAGSCLGTVINANASWVVLKIAMDVWEYRDIKTTLLKVICKLAEINTIKT